MKVKTQETLAQKELEEITSTIIHNAKKELETIRKFTGPFYK